MASLQRCLVVTWLVPHNATSWKAFLCMLWEIWETTSGNLKLQSETKGACRRSSWLTMIRQMPKKGFLSSLREEEYTVTRRTRTEDSRMRLHWILVPSNWFVISVDILLESSICTYWGRCICRITVCLWEANIVQKTLQTLNNVHLILVLLFVDFISVQMECVRCTKCKWNVLDVQNGMC